MLKQLHISIQLPIFEVVNNAITNKVEICNTTKVQKN